MCLTQWRWTSLACGCALALLTMVACTPSHNQDALRQASRGVDEMGMKPYVFAMLQTGDTTARPDSVLSALFAGHMANIERLAEEGKLVVAGPFYDVPRAPESWRGLFVLNTADTAEARVWVDQDPAVQAGVFDVVLAPWFSSGALQAVQGLHQDLDASI
ncbi:YciI family protein [Flavobacteriales bacterium]|jgi:uncharacterized protein YciI|nr:YciI family protein [Flavobacteriales bacterium]